MLRLNQVREPAFRTDTQTRCDSYRCRALPPSTMNTPYNRSAALSAGLFVDAVMLRRDRGWVGAVHGH